MLTENQLKAVELCDKPLLIIAGPGTGKTTTLCHKVEYLVNEKNVLSDSILALTFTEKAAEEMSQRIEVCINKPFVAKTFHGFARELVEEFKDHLTNVEPSFHVIDESQSLLFFYENFAQFNISSVKNQSQSQLAYELRNMISRLKDNGVSLDRFESVDFDDIQIKVDLMKVYASYEKFKKENNFLDYGDLLLNLKKLLAIEEVKDELKKRFKYVVVDEFQDTNKLQLEILLLLNSKNIMFVGDRKQSIYAFRGARYENFSLLKTTCKDLETVVLEQNFRSSKKVVESLNSCIEHIAGEEEKLKSELEIEGEIKRTTLSDEFSQAKYIAEIIDSVPQEKSVAILTRRKSELLFIGSQLKSEEIDFELVQLNPLFENEAVKEILLVLEFLSKPKEANVELFSLLQSSGLRQETIKRISRKASIKERSIYNVLVTETNISDFMGERVLVREFLRKINTLLELLRSRPSLMQLVQEIIAQFSYYQRAEFSGNQEAIHSLNDFLIFIQQHSTLYKSSDIKRFLQICEFSKQLDLAFSSEEKSSRIQLMTYHQAKGREFDIVIMPYLNDKRFPAMYRKPLFESAFDQTKEEFLEEEKRLFFVGLSRAKENLHLLSVKKFRENKLNSKLSSHLELISDAIPQEEIMDQRYGYKLSPDEEIKLDIYKRIRKAIINNKFDLAKKDIELLSQLFESKESLTTFIQDKHPDLDHYKAKLKDLSKEPVDIDPSSFVYSVSQLQVYQSCPKKYLYQYIYKVPTISKHYFDFGTSMHKVLELLIDDFSNSEMTKEELYSKGAQMLEKYWISNAYESVEQEQEYYNKGLDSLKKFIETELALRSETQRQIKEKEGNFLITFKDRKVQGVIDRIDKTDKGFEIIDYKTSNSMESEKNLQKNMQLYVYAKALEHKYNELPQSVGLWYLIHDKLVSVKYNEVKEEEIEEQILSLIENIEAKNFKATPSFFSCKFCDFNKICPQAKK